MESLDYAREYVSSYGLAVAFQTPDGVPLHPWRRYAEEGMDVETVERLHAEYVAKPKRYEIRTAILTGPYLASRPKPFLVIDVDAPPARTREEKLELMVSLARRGFQVVETARGFHLHAFVEGDGDLPYVVRLFKRGEERAVGEGGVLFPHPWSTVPTSRPVGEAKWMRYAFIAPDGSRVTSFKDYKARRDELFPGTMSLADALDAVSLFLATEPRFFKPYEGAVPVRVTGAEEPARKVPVYANFAEFYASVASVLPLPACVALALYNFAVEIDDISTAEKLAAWLQDLVPLGKVQRGERFLVSAAVTLFLAHVVEDIRFDEILAVVSAAVEDYPSDSGAPLDRKLAYLLLFDKDGRVYPRYGGLGSMTPAQVWNCEERCPLAKVCRGRSPWNAYRRVAKRVSLADEVHRASEEFA